jgi:hypothetical protein
MTAAIATTVAARAAHARVFLRLVSCLGKASPESTSPAPKAGLVTDSQSRADAHMLEP